MNPLARVARLDFDRGVRELQGVFIALLVKPQRGEVRESLVVARAPVQGSLICILCLFDAAEVV